MEADQQENYKDEISEHKSKTEEKSNASKAALKRKSVAKIVKNKKKKN